MEELVVANNIVMFYGQRAKETLTRDEQDTYTSALKYIAADFQRRTGYIVADMNREENLYGSNEY